jgi:hypothetical protein
MQFTGSQRCSDEWLLFGSQGFASQFPGYCLFVFPDFCPFCTFMKTNNREIFVKTNILITCNLMLTDNLFTRHNDVQFASFSCGNFQNLNIILRMKSFIFLSICTVVWCFRKTPCRRCVLL